MDNNPNDAGAGQLPAVDTYSAAGAPSMAAGSPVGVQQGSTVSQQAQAILSASGVSPYQMTQSFIHLKTQYLASRGVQIGG